MRCPWCSADDDKVVDSRPSEGAEAIRRRRACLACGRRFTTYERVEEVGLVVRKRDGGKEPFDRDKLEAGIRKALSSRPVTNLAIDQMVGRIETIVRTLAFDQCVATVARVNVHSPAVTMALLKKLGWKLTMLFGILGHAVRFVVFAFFDQPEHQVLIILVQVLHGQGTRITFITRLPG